MSDARHFPVRIEKSKCRTNSQKNDKQCVKNYRPASLLPICCKILERFIYNMRFSYFIGNNLISEYQSGFKPPDSFVNQLFGITNKTFSSFNPNDQVRGAFLDISKAFYNMRHKWVIHKLKRNGISGNLLSLLIDFLRTRKKDYILLSCHVRVSEWIHTLWLPECQGTPHSKQLLSFKLHPVAVTFQYRWIQLLSLKFQILCIGLSLFREQKFCHNFQDSLDQICNCGNTIESTRH